MNEIKPNKIFGYKKMQSTYEKLSFVLTEEARSPDGINIRTREGLLEWIIQVCNEKVRNMETYFTIVEIIDAYIHRFPQNVTRKNIQLIGMVALSLGDSTKTLNDNEIVELCDDAYSVKSLYKCDNK